MLRAVVFDLDDTIFEERQYILSGFRAVADYLQTRGLVKDDALAHFLQVYQEGVRGRVFDEALTRMGLQPEPALVFELVQRYRTHQPTITPYPDAHQLLDELRGRYVLGLLSDGYAEAQRNKVSALGIRDYFQAIMLSDELGRDHWKPSSLPYRVLLHQLSVAPEEALYIGDNPAKDFVTARQMGWWTVRIRRPSGQYSSLVPLAGYEAHFEVSCLRYIPILPLPWRPP